MPGELTCARASGSTALPGELTMSSSVSSSCLASNPGVVHSGVVAPDRSAPPRRCAESGRHWRTALTSAAAFGENGTACTDARTQSLKLGDGACEGPTSTLAKSTPTRVARGRPADRNLPAGHSMHSVRPFPVRNGVRPSIVLFCRHHLHLRKFVINSLLLDYYYICWGATRPRWRG